MLTVDVAALEPLGRRGPWQLGDGAVLKASAHGAPLRTLAQAQDVFDAYRTAYDAGAGTPRPMEVVRVGEGFGVVVEHVPGLTLMTHIAFGSYSPHEAGEVLGLLMQRLHGLVCTTGRDVGAVFRRNARVLAPLLPARIAERLVPLVDGIPTACTFLHGDVHACNVVVSEGEPRLIDLELCGFGHPVFELAIARTRLLLNDNSLSIFVDKAGNHPAKYVWESCLRTYFPGATPAFLEEVDRRTAALAEVEHCCFKFRIARTTKQDLSDKQRARIELCANRLGVLLPQIDRLDLSFRSPPKRRSGRSWTTWSRGS